MKDTCEELIDCIKFDSDDFFYLLQKLSFVGFFFKKSYHNNLGKARKTSTKGAIFD